MLVKRGEIIALRAAIVNNWREKFTLLPLTTKFCLQKVNICNAKLNLAALFSEQVKYGVHTIHCQQGEASNTKKMSIERRLNKCDAINCFQAFSAFFSIFFGC